MPIEPNNINEFKAQLAQADNSWYTGESYGETVDMIFLDAVPDSVLFYPALIFILIAIFKRKLSVPFALIALALGILLIGKNW